MLNFSCSLDEEVLHITGSLIPTHTGCVRWLSKHGVEGGQQINRFVSSQHYLHLPLLHCQFSNTFVQ